MTNGTMPATDSQRVAELALERIATRLAKNWEIDRGLKQNKQAWALAIVDALNFSAKLKENPAQRKEIYKEKSVAVSAACALGCEAGLGRDDDGKEVLYMYAPGIGVVSVHTEYLDDIPTAKIWQHQWPALRRQRWSIAALRNKAIRDLLDDYTSPNGGKKDSAEFQRKAKALERYYPYADFEY